MKYPRGMCQEVGALTVSSSVTNAFPAACQSIDGLHGSAGSHRADCSAQLNMNYLINCHLPNGPSHDTAGTRSEAGREGRNELFCRILFYAAILRPAVSRCGCISALSYSVGPCGLIQSTERASAMCISLVLTD